MLCGGLIAWLRRKAFRVLTGIELDKLEQETEDYDARPLPPRVSDEGRMMEWDPAEDTKVEIPSVPPLKGGLADRLNKEKARRQ
jgi:hypothetical protein